MKSNVSKPSTRPDEGHDPFQEELARKREQLRACQQERGLKSCLPCQQVIGCPLRNDYVAAVYLSMNKGQGGGFEF